MKFQAPAKLILSGEHAVVHGAPALAMAVDYHVTAEVVPQQAKAVTLAIPQFDFQRTLDTTALNDVRERIQQQYKLFLQNKIAINEVLSKPVELIEYALSIILSTYQIQAGMKLTLTSTVPIGCGMGSSAAAIVSTMYAVTSLVGFNLPTQELYPLALTAENMQHGYSSGLDLHLAFQGGCLYRHGTQLSPRPIATMPLYLVNTGVPTVTTGQCVAAVRPYFTGEKDNLLDSFSAVTKEMDQAWQATARQKIVNAVRANHRLLTRIGVVPKKVQAFISQIEEKDGAAKICGAGAISGEQGGVVLVLIGDPTALATLCNDYHYSYAPIMGASRGVHEF